jgi:glutaredoxin/cytochrome c biogenesis protein CcdA
MNKKIFIIFIFLILIMSGNILAQEDIPIETEELVLREDHIYLYGLDTCPYCQDAKSFMDTLKNKYDIQYSYIELSKTKKNEEEFFIQQQRLGINVTSVPLIIINDKYWVGFDNQVKNEITQHFKNKKLIKDKDIGKKITKKNIFFNKEFLRNKGPIFSTIIIGFIDGFNPCSLWVLTLLLGFLVHYKSRKKMFIVGLSFLLTTALVYGLFITGVLKGIIFIQQTVYLNIFLGVFVLMFGLINLKDYFYFKKGISATISDKNKSKLIKKMRTLITNKKNIATSVLFTVLIALTAAIVELPCTSGFPIIWSDMVAKNGINLQLSKYIPLILIYLTMYLFDELIVFMIAIKTLNVKKMDLQMGKNMKLIIGYIMFWTGLDILFKTKIIYSFTGLLVILGLSGVSYLLTKKIQISS